MDRSRGLCAIAVGAHLAGTRGGVVMGTGLLVYEVGLHAQGVVGASVAGVHAQGAMSPFDGVMVHLGGVQTGWAGVTGLASGQGAGAGLAKDDGALLDLLGHLFTLGLGGGTGECGLFALGVMSPMIGLVVCSRRWLAAGS